MLINLESLRSSFVYILLCLKMIPKVISNARVSPTSAINCSYMEITFSHVKVFANLKIPMHGRPSESHLLLAISAVI